MTHSNLFPQIFKLQTQQLLQIQKAGKKSLQQWQTLLQALWDPFMLYEHLEYTAPAVLGPIIFKYETTKMEVTLCVCR